VLKASTEGIFHEIFGERISYVVEPNRPKEPPATGTEHPLQRSNREKRKSVGKDQGNAEEHKNRNWWRRPYPTQPNDKSDVRKVGGGKC
jgi:hypothetical protein